MTEVNNVGRSSNVNTVHSAEEPVEVSSAEQTPVNQQDAEDTNRTVDALKKQFTESRSVQDLQGKMQCLALDEQLNKQQSQNPGVLQFHQTGAPPPTNSQGQQITHTQLGVDQLGDAASRGDLAKIKQLIASGVDVNGKDSVNGETPLIQAIATKDPKIIDELIKAGAKIDERATNGQTALMHASKTTDRESIMHHLIHQHKADVNVQDSAGRTALMLTAIGNSPKSMKVLLDANAKTNVLDGKSGIDPEPGQNALMFAAARGNKDCVDLLLKAGVDVDMLSRKGNTALSLAAGRGQADVVEMLLKANANPNVPDPQKRTPVMIAAANGYDNVVKVLTKEFAALDEQDTGGSTAVYEAVANQKHGALKVLLDAHANPDMPLTLPAFTKNWTALMAAARDGDIKSVELLVHAGAKQSIQNSDGNTALMVAQEALKNGTDLSDAERKNYAAIIKLLQQTPKSP